MRSSISRCILIIAIALVGMAQQKPASTITGKLIDWVGHPVRCALTQKEAASVLVWRGGLEVHPDHAVAFRISYPAGTPDKEIERCIQQMHDSGLTQQYFKDWAETEYSNADVSRLWEIYIGDKLICFVGKPKGEKQ